MELNIPGHLAIAIEAAARLDTGNWTTNEVLVAAIADLESFVRTNPSDDFLIDAGPLEPLPITKRVINTFEELAQATNGKVPLGFAAIQRVGVLVSAVRTLELKTQELEGRLAQLEQDRSR